VITSPASRRSVIASWCANLLFAGLLTSAPALAELPRAASVPGGVALVPLGPRVTGEEQRPRAWLGEQQVFVAANGNEWVAVVGLALDTFPGTYALRVEGADDSRRVDFTVANKTYPEQRITLKDTRKVELSPSDLARVESELAVIRQLKQHWRDSSDTDTDFVLPAHGRLTGRFGVRRFFNGEPRSPHAGFDIAAPRGSVVRSNTHGIVLAVGDYFFNGKTVFVDHGNGLISMYCHLDDFAVETGASVSKGQRLGSSGMTGRATGPHLHWSVILNGAMVDPELFIKRLATAR